jgi:hypothetical protein
MPGVGTSRIAALAVAVLAGACDSNAQPARDAAQPVADAGADVDVSADSGIDAQVDVTLDPPDVPWDLGPADGIPRADEDGGACSRSVPAVRQQVICFGSDPAPYEEYLTPDAGAAGPGRCPTMSDFPSFFGESCGYVGCGPLLGSAVSQLPDAGAIIGDAGTSCCFLVALECGV